MTRTKVDSIYSKNNLDIKISGDLMEQAEQKVEEKYISVEQ